MRFYSASRACWVGDGATSLSSATPKSRPELLQPLHVQHVAPPPPLPFSHLPPEDPQRPKNHRQLPRRLHSLPTPAARPARRGARPAPGARPAQPAPPPVRLAGVPSGRLPHPRRDDLPARVRLRASARSACRACPLKPPRHSHHPPPSPNSPSAAIAKATSGDQRSTARSSIQQSRRRLVVPRDLPHTRQHANAHASSSAAASETLDADLAKTGRSVPTSAPPWWRR
jgi:hypothetical protein